MRAICFSSVIIAPSGLLLFNLQFSSKIFSHTKFVTHPSHPRVHLDDVLPIIVYQCLEHIPDELSLLWSNSRSLVSMSIVSVIVDKKQIKKIKVLSCVLLDAFKLQTPSDIVTERACCCIAIKLEHHYHGSLKTDQNGCQGASLQLQTSRDVFQVS
jgi:hypothetical protein